MPNRYFSEELNFVCWFVSELNCGYVSEERVALRAASRGLPCYISYRCRNSANTRECTPREVPPTSVTIGLSSTLGLHFWSSKYTSSRRHSVQVFVLNSMVIFLLLESRNRNWPSLHVFNSPAFTFVIFLVIVSLESICASLESFLSCYLHVINWKLLERKFEQIELWL